MPITCTSSSSKLGSSSRTWHSSLVQMPLNANGKNTSSTLFCPRYELSVTSSRFWSAR